jgi:hypothetical protein
MSKSRIGQRADALVLERPKAEASGLKFRNHFNVKCFSPEGELLWNEEMHNVVCDVGMQLLLNTMFGGAAASSPWYLGLINNSGPTPNIGASTDTMGSHTNWAENTAYSEATREVYTEGAASGSGTVSMDNVGNEAQFTMSSTSTIFGIFVTSNNTKGGTTGTLWATAAFSAPQLVNSGSVLQVTYTVTVA